MAKEMIKEYKEDLSEHYLRRANSICDSRIKDINDRMKDSLGLTELVKAIKNIFLN